MLSLVCMKLGAWPAGIQEMSGLQYLDLACKRLQDGDLAALQHIPHVSLCLYEFSSFLLTSGAWESLKISGWAGFSINFSNVDAFVKGTKSFLFVCSSQEAKEMYRQLRAACMRQWVACHEREHMHGDSQIARLSNVRPCWGSDNAVDYHEPLICTSGFWPDDTVYPELYR